MTPFNLFSSLQEPQVYADSLLLTEQMRNHTHECERICIYIERVSNGSRWVSVCFGKKKGQWYKTMQCGWVWYLKVNIMFNTLRYSILKSHVDLRLFIFLCLMTLSSVYNANPVQHTFNSTIFYFLLHL